MTTPEPAAPAIPAAGVLRPLGLGDVTITGGFWRDRQETNATATIPHLEYWTDREGWTGNFDLAARGALPAGRRGREFSDSEVYKLLEAMAWEIGRSGGEALETRFRALAARVAAAQEDDGYLNTAFGRAGQRPRWSDLEWGHELYCLGHLFQAAVARARTSPGADDGLLAVACRAADLVCAEFGPQQRAAVCGHPEIESALVELGRVTGEQRYLDQAVLFIGRRGHGLLGPIPFGQAYFQDEIPVREAAVLRGHAVRAGYLAAGAVDVAVETGDAGLLDAVAAQWATTVARRTYLTGGQGSRAQDEAYGDDWDLPPEHAYSETCAGVASVLLSWRLLLARGCPGYADLTERTLYNVVAGSVAADGQSFFYANALQQRRAPGGPPLEGASRQAASGRREVWFDVSCCPPNVARLLASLATYLATVDDGGLQLHQYAPARIRTRLPDGRGVGVDVETRYPDVGVVRVVVREAPPGEWTLTLRVPAWAAQARLTHYRPGLHGTPPPDTRIAGPGTVSLTAAFAAGDVVELQFPVAARFTAADPRIDGARGCLAVERGPQVLCLESVDLAAPGGQTGEDLGELLHRLQVDPAQPPVERDGRTTVSLRVAAPPASDPQTASWPYGPPDAGGQALSPPVLEVPLLPYHARANRGPAAMRVWLPSA